MNTEPIVGVLETLNPVLALADTALDGLGDGFRIAVFGIVAGIVSMLLYWLVSPQARLRGLAESSKAFQRTMKTGDAGGGNVDIAGSLGAGLARVGLAFGPAVLSSLPVLAMIGYLNANYAYEAPIPGEPVAVLAEGGAQISADHGQAFASGWVIGWPHDGESVTIRDGDGHEILSLTGTTQPGSARKPGLVSFLFGAPAGALPAQGTVDEIVIEPTPRDILQPRLVFPYQWTIPFFLAVILASLSVKFIFRIS